MDRPFWLRLPSLDMNTAHGECIPKLEKEGVKVMYHGIDCHTISPTVGQWAFINQTGLVAHGDNFYVNLTEYLKEKAQ